jgi:hypothetical protein
MRRTQLAAWGREHPNNLDNAQGIAKDLQSPMDKGKIELNHVRFVTSPRWYVIQRSAFDDEMLIFRKYSFSLIDGSLGGVEKTKNILDFGCQRNSKYLDYLVFHFPNWAHSGLDSTEWLPRLHLNIALNKLSFTLEAEGEYKNNSIFIDFNEQQQQHLIRLMAADEILVDYGTPKERLNIEQRTQTPDGAGNVVGFIEDLVTKVVSPSMDGGKVLSFDTDNMLKTCLAYKQQGASALKF